MERVATLAIVGAAFLAGCDLSESEQTTTTTNPQVTVPNVVGEDYDKAERAIKGAELRPKIVTPGDPLNIPDIFGTVEDQSPPAGIDVEPGTRVVLQVPAS